MAGISAFMTPFVGSSVTIALPAIGREFSLDAILLGWVATVYLLAAAVFLLPFGKIADISGRKRIYLIGISLFTLSSLLAGLSGSIAVLLIFRVAQGIGSAMVFGTGVAILTSVVPAARRGRALGINVAFTYAGLSLGPVLGGLLTEQLGWRSIFWANVPLGLAALVVVAWKLKGEWVGSPGDRFDWLGSIIAGFSLAFLIYGFSLLPSWSGLLFAAAGLAGCGAFAWWEERAAYPVLAMSLFRGNRVFAMSNLAALIHYSATFALTFFLSLYLQYIKEFTPQVAGLILISQPVLMAIVSPISGRLSDRHQSRILASIGMGMIAAMLFLLATLSQSSSIVFVVVCLVVLGTGYGLFSSPNTNAIMSSVEKPVYGVASATMGTMRLIGQMFSMGIAMLIVALHVGDVEIVPRLYPQLLASQRTAFVIFGVLCIAGVFASLARGKTVAPVSHE